MPSESPTCVRTGGDSADARIEYISPGRSLQPTKSFIGIENLGLKSTNLAKPLLCLRSCLRSSNELRLDPRGACALPRTPPWWWVLGAGCGAYDCDCVWVCASNKARRCCSCMCHAAAPVLPLLHLVVLLLLPPPFLVLVLMQVLVLLLMPLVLVHLLLFLFLIVLLPLLATAAVPLLALVQQRAARRETTHPV